MPDPTTSPATSTAPAAQSSTAAPPAAASPPPPQTTGTSPGTEASILRQAQDAQAAPTPPSAPAPPEPSPKVRPEGVPESFWDADKGALKTKEWADSFEELRAFKASEEARKAALPAQPDLYKPTLPEKFQIPADVQEILKKTGGAIEVDAASPLMQVAREFAFKYHLPQEALSDMIGFEAMRHADLIRQQAAFVKARDEALGGNVESRKLARDNFLKASSKQWFPGDEGDKIANAMLTMAVDSPHFRWFEKASEALSKQGITSYSSGGREPVEGRADGRPDNWDSLSSVDKRHWELQNRKNAA